MKPFNRHLLVQLIEEEEQESQSVIILPTDYEKPKSQYLVAKVLSVAEDCKLTVNKEELIIVEGRMLHTIEIYEKTYYLIQENYIFGRLNSDEIE
jgi:co-chaperonin GroES (HSP10)